MSQKKVDAYKKSKADREKTSKKEVTRRRLEIGIVLAVIVVGIVWFAIAGISRSAAGSTQTVSLDTEAIDSYLNSIQE